MSQILQRFFLQKNLIAIHARYDLYYQISLWEYIFEITQDSNKCYQKIVAMNLQVDPNQSLANIFDILKKHSDDGDFTGKFEYYLKVSALLHSLEDYLENDKEMKDKENFYEQTKKLIIEDRLWNNPMQKQLDVTYKSICKAYEILITPDMVIKMQEGYLEYLKENDDEIL